MNRITMVAVPLFIMIFAALIVANGEFEPKGSFNLDTGRVNVNDKEYSVTTSSFGFEKLLTVFGIVATVLGICIAMSVKIFHSGVSGSVIPIVFACSILGAFYTMLSGLSVKLFLNIPFFGIPIFFGLTIMFIIGLVGVAVQSGGD